MSVKAHTLFTNLAANVGGNKRTKLTAFLCLSVCSLEAIELPSQPDPSPSRSRINDFPGIHQKAEPAPRQQLLNQTLGKKSYLGVSGEPVSKVLAEQLNIRSGMRILEIDPGSPAAKLGLKKNDILLEAGKTAISQVTDLDAVLLKYAPHSLLHIRIIRQGQYYEANVTLAEVPDLQSRPQHNQLKRDTSPPAIGGGRVPERDPAKDIRHGGRSMNEEFNKLLGLMGEKDPRFEQMLGLIEKLDEGGVDIKELDFQDLLKGDQFFKNLKDQADQQRQPKDPLQIQPRVRPQAAQPSEPKVHEYQGEAPSIKQNTSISLSDGLGKITLTDSLSFKTIKVTNLAGDVVYSGPYNTSQDRAKIPAAILKRIEKSGIDQAK